MAYERNRVTPWEVPLNPMDDLDSADAVLRMSATKLVWRFVVNRMNLIDLAAIAPCVTVTL